METIEVQMIKTVPVSDTSYIEYFRVNGIDKTQLLEYSHTDEEDRMMIYIVTKSEDGDHIKSFYDEATKDLTDTE